MIVSKQDFDPLKSYSNVLIKDSFKFILGKRKQEIICKTAAKSSSSSSFKNVQQLISQFEDLFIYYPNNVRTQSIGDFLLNQECSNIKSNITLHYLGALRKDYYPMPSIRIREPHLALVQNGSSLSITIAGKLTFCKDSVIKCYPNALVFTTDSRTVLLAGDPFKFKPTWIFNTDWITVERFKNANVQQLSRYNFDYFTDLILSGNSKLTALIPHKDADNPTLIIRDVTAKFKTRYNDIETTEVENYKNVVSELFLCCEDFLGVYVKMKMELVHLAKILMPNYLQLVASKWSVRWSNLIDNLTVSLYLSKDSLLLQLHFVFAAMCIYLTVSLQLCKHPRKESKQIVSCKYHTELSCLLSDHSSIIT